VQAELTVLERYFELEYAIQKHDAPLPPELRLSAHASAYCAVKMLQSLLRDRRDHYDEA
jgi:hypothetical protein